ncbi:MAG: hypothetical protein Q8L12_04460, partial [Methylibium sp.]|nr:hypothetical protein [Methylibium sp.]
MNTEARGSGSGAAFTLPIDRNANGADVLQLALLALGFAALFVPTYLELARTVWSTDEQGHGPIILAASGWMFYQRRHVVAALPMAGRTTGAWGVLLSGLL